MRRNKAHPSQSLEELDALLQGLVACFNEQDRSRALLQAVGLVVIQHLAPPAEVDALTARWKERWRETVRLEAEPMRRQI